MALHHERHRAGERGGRRHQGRERPQHLRRHRHRHQLLRGDREPADHLSGGTVTVTARDDAINAVEDGYGDFDVAPNAFVRFTGGTTVIDSAVDGIDSNGSVTFAGGTVVVSGPTTGSPGEGAIDSNGPVYFNGGTVFGARARPRWRCCACRRPRAGLGRTPTVQQPAGRYAPPPGLRRSGARLLPGAQDLPGGGLLLQPDRRTDRPTRSTWAAASPVPTIGGMATTGAASPGPPG